MTAMLISIALAIVLYFLALYLGDRQVAAGEKRLAEALRHLGAGVTVVDLTSGGGTGGATGSSDGAASGTHGAGTGSADARGSVATGAHAGSTDNAARGSAASGAHAGSTDSASRAAHGNTRSGSSTGGSDARVNSGARPHYLLILPDRILALRRENAANYRRGHERQQFLEGAARRAEVAMRWVSGHLAEVGEDAWRSLPVRPVVALTRMAAEGAEVNGVPFVNPEEIKGYLKTVISVEATGGTHQNLAPNSEKLGRESRFQLAEYLYNLV